MGVWWVTTPATVTSNEGGWNAAGGKNAWIDQMSALKDKSVASATSTSCSAQRAPQINKISAPVLLEVRFESLPP